MYYFTHISIGCGRLIVQISRFISQENVLSSDYIIDIHHEMDYNSTQQSIMAKTVQIV